MAKTVLIVDDEQGMLRILTIILQRAGYDILTASNGDDALQLLQSHHPDVVVLDDMMPGLSGGDLCTYIKQEPTLRDIPVIMHSAGVNVKNSAWLEQIGADGGLSKPCPAPVMMNTIAQCLARGA